MIISSPSTFYSDEKVKKSIEKQRESIRFRTTEDLLRIASRIRPDRIDIARKQLLALSFELSTRGVAPRYQRLFDIGKDYADDDEMAEKTKDFKSKILSGKRADGIIVDLHHLWLLRKGSKKPPISSNSKWQVLFDSNEFDLELAAQIADRQINNSLKVRGLAITPLEGLGCIIIYPNESKTIREKSSEFVRRRNIVFAWQNKDMTADEIIDFRKNLLKAAEMDKLANKRNDYSATGAAKLLKLITGKEHKRQNVKSVIDIEINGIKRKCPPSAKRVRKKETLAEKNYRLIFAEFNEDN